MEVALPTCHICQGQMSRGLYEAAEWTCMRCWGGWLAGAPEPLQVVQEVGIPRPWKLRGPDHVIEYHAPTGLDWSDAE